QWAGGGVPANVQNAEHLPKTPLTWRGNIIPSPYALALTNQPWPSQSVGGGTIPRRTTLLLAVYRLMAHRSAAVAMKKYWHVINIGIQNTLVYRVNFLFRAVFALIPLAAVLFLWRAIYAGKEGGGEVAGYTLAQMTSYYLLVTIVDALTAVNEDDWQIAADIKDGNISQFLLKPIDYLTYRLCLFGTGRLIYTAIAVVPVTLFILLQRKFFVLPPDWATFGWFLVSTVMTALLQFFMSYT